MDYMRRALRIARRAIGFSSPNPPVGAVVVKDGRIVGEGFTLPPGEGHAEAIALRNAGEAARGATLYCTLEPCAHYGRVPPCSKAIIAAGVAEVHMAMIDPNPLVNGKGKAELEAAGIRCYVGEGEREAGCINEAYVKHITTGMPLVTAKFAMSLDGKIATRTGQSKWITSKRARSYAQSLRRDSDAVMVGVNTVLIDDPALTARDGRGRLYARQPFRVVLDSHGRTPPTAQVLSQPGRTIISTTRAGAEAMPLLAREGVEVLVLPERDGYVDARLLLKLLSDRGVISVLVEGGGTVLGTLFDQRLVDKVAVFIAPIIIGGRDAPSPVMGSGILGIEQALHLKEPRTRRLGPDVLVTGYIS